MSETKKVRGVLLPAVILIVVIGGLYKLIQYFYGHSFLG
jgi:hypothetical protein